MGKVNSDVSLPIEYEIEGFEISPPHVGKPYDVARTVRNGVVKAGIFQSTPIQEIHIGQCPITFKQRAAIVTLNSVYEVEYQ